jgi:beta-lactam-binding protein with PASTA domain
MSLENNDEIEKLKNRYKRTEPEESENKKVEIIESNNQFINFLNKSRNTFKYIVVFFSFLIGLFLILFIADKWILPSLVHDREIVTVPNVEGLTLKEASEKLASNKLYYEIVSEQYSAKEKGFILKQTPDASKSVKSKRPIFITISKGKEIVSMPDLTGISIREARVNIYNKGLNIGDITYTYNELVPKDTVISQNIKTKSELIFGDTVDLIVSKGPENQIFIPKLIGLPLEGIEDQLSSQGFNLGNVEFLENDTFTPGTIISQLPQSNELAQQGEYINIVVAK